MIEAGKNFTRVLQEEGRQAFDLMDLIDRLKRRGVTCHPRLSPRTGRYRFSFIYDGETLAPSNAQKVIIGHGKLLYDPIRHDPILQRLCEAYEAGLPQPDILRDGEVALPDMPPAEPDASQSPAILTSILRLNDNPGAVEDPSLAALPSGYDELTSLSEASLDERLSGVVLPVGLSGLSDGHRRSAKRWMLRGLMPALAVVREIQRVSATELESSPP